jgi:nucleotide-binding universal stress UspA family protein
VLKGKQMFKKILVCLDGSKVAEQILPYVIESSMRFKSEIILFQVVTADLVIPPPEDIHIPPLSGKVERKSSPVSDLGTTSTVEPKVGVQLAGIEREQVDTRRYLDRIAVTLRERGLTARTVAWDGEVGESIVHYANSQKVELIALTSRGQSGVKRRAMGHVTRFVLKETEIPILLIKPK